jgi:hypothetical protein
VRRLIDGIEAELIAERARREGAERRDRTLRDQIVKEAQAQQELRRERDEALEEVSTLKLRIENIEHEKSNQDGRAQLLQRIKELENERQRSEQEKEKGKIRPLEQTSAKPKVASDPLVVKPPESLPKGFNDPFVRIFVGGFLFILAVAILVMWLTHR